MDGSPETPGFRGRVLLVEDEPDVLAYVARLLREGKIGPGFGQPLGHLLRGAHR